MSEQVVVSDASCLVVLARIGEMSLLQQLFGAVRITREVAEEFGEQLPDWIQIVEVADKDKVKFLELNLDKGEASSIVYCLEQNEPTLLIIDERKGRRIAAEFKINIIGTLGLIIKARQKNLINSVEEILEKLERADFRISQSLKIEILKMFGEQL